MGFLDHVHIANNARLEQFAPLTHQGTRYGWVRRDRLDLLKDWPEAFQVLAHHVEIDLWVLIEKQELAGFSTAFDKLDHACFLPVTQ